MEVAGREEEEKVTYRRRALELGQTASPVNTRRGRSVAGEDEGPGWELDGCFDIKYRHEKKYPG